MYRLSLVLRIKHNHWLSDLSRTPSYVFLFLVLLHNDNIIYKINVPYKIKKRNYDKTPIFNKKFHSMIV